MPFNLLIFPIVGGYYILIRSKFYRYRQQRVDRQKLIFNSIFAGILLLICAWIITGAISRIAPSFVKSIQAYYPIHQNYFGTACCSFILAIGATEFFNLFLSQTKSISRAINRIGNEFERLCLSCYKQTKLIQLTLKNEKSYVGWVKSLPIPHHSNYLSILPVYSGFRNKDDKTLTFTTQYLDVYATYIQNGEALDIRDLANLVIKIDDIISANMFDPDMYDRFQENVRVEVDPPIEKTDEPNG